MLDTNYHYGMGKVDSVLEVAKWRNRMIRGGNILVIRRSKSKERVVGRIWGRMASRRTQSGQVLCWMDRCIWTRRGYSFRHRRKLLRRGRGCIFWTRRIRRDTLWRSLRIGRYEGGILLPWTSMP